MIAPLWTVQLFNIKCGWGKTGLEFFFQYILYTLLQEEKSSWQKKKMPGPWKIDDYN